MKQNKQAIEAALFMSSEPLDLAHLAKITGMHSLGLLKQLIEEVTKDYEGKGIQVVETPQGWQMQVKPEILPKVSHLAPYADIPEGSKRTLALILFKEPAKQSDIVKVQGNKAYAYIKKLDAMGLVKSKQHGHTKLLVLTSEFEKYFGEKKESLRKKLHFAMQKDGLAVPTEPQKQVTSFSEAPTGMAEELADLISAVETKKPKEKGSLDLARKMTTSSLPVLDDDGAEPVKTERTSTLEKLKEKISTVQEETKQKEQQSKKKQEQEEMFGEVSF